MTSNRSSKLPKKIFDLDSTSYAIATFLSLRDLANYSMVSKGTYNASESLYVMERERMIEEAKDEIKQSYHSLASRHFRDLDRGLDLLKNLDTDIIHIYNEDEKGVVDANNGLTRLLEEKERPVRIKKGGVACYLTLAGFSIGLCYLASVHAADATNPKSIRTFYICLGILMGVIGTGLCTFTARKMYQTRSANDSLVQKLGVFHRIKNPAMRALSLSRQQEDEKGIAIDTEYTQNTNMTDEQNNDDDRAFTPLLKKQGGEKVKAGIYQSESEYKNKDEDIYLCFL